MHLSRVVPEHIVIQHFEWCKQHFITMNSTYRAIRQTINDLGPYCCWWCEHEFMDGESMALASRPNKTNVLLCQECAEKCKKEVSCADTDVGWCTQESESEASAPSPESANKTCPRCGSVQIGLAGHCYDCEASWFCGKRGGDWLKQTKPHASPLPQPDVQTACSPEAIDEVLEADFPEDAIEEKLEAVGREEQAFCEVVAQTVTEENVALRSQIKQIREDIKKADTMACSTIEKLLCNRLLNRVDRITGQK